MKYCLTLLLLCSLSTRSFADETTDLIEKAIKAIAKDESKLPILKTHTSNSKGLTILNGMDHPTTRMLKAVYPNMYRVNFDIGDKPKVLLTLGIIDENGWKLDNQIQAQQLHADDVSDFRADIYAYWCSYLLPLKERNVTTKTIPGVKVGDFNTVGLKVTKRAWPDISIYFDEKNYQVRLIAYRSRESGVSHQKELIFEDFKDTEGFSLPTKCKIKLDGREVFRWDSIEHTFPRTLERKEFETPKTERIRQ